MPDFGEKKKKDIASVFREPGEMEMLSEHEMKENHVQGFTFYTRLEWVHKYVLAIYFSLLFKNKHLVLEFLFIICLKSGSSFIWWFIHSVFTRDKSGLSNSQKTRIQSRSPSWLWDPAIYTIPCYFPECAGSWNWK